LNTDRFPEAFRRYEEVVDVDKIESWRELKSSFASWTGANWKDTNLQNSALAVEARKRSIPLQIERALTWRHEIVIRRNKGYEIFRDRRTGRFIRKP
jgi:hypothetical protein